MDNLFSELSLSEAESIDGGGLFGAIGGAIIGTVGGLLVGSVAAVVVKATGGTQQQVENVLFGSMVAGLAYGTYTGAIAPIA